MIFDSPFSLFQLLSQLSVFPAWRPNHSYNMNKDRSYVAISWHFLSGSNNEYLYSLAWLLKTNPSNVLIYWINVETPTLLHAFDEAITLGQGGGRVLDPLWDPQLISDQGVSEQGDLPQRKAVGGQPVGKHRLRFVWEEKDFRHWMYKICSSSGFKKFKMYFLVLSTHSVVKPL